MADKGFITAIQRKDHSGETYSVPKKFQGRLQRFVEFFLEKAQGISSPESEEPKQGEWMQLDEDAELPFE